MPALSIFPGLTPQRLTDRDPGSLELGVKFFSDLDALVVGARIYHNLATDKPVVANLWTSGGALLATKSATLPGGVGWRSVLFDAPVPIVGGVTYVVSRFWGVADFASSDDYFINSYNYGPLHVPPNGSVYAYTPTSAFPTTSGGAKYYWADVLVEYSESGLGSARCLAF